MFGQFLLCCCDRESYVIWLYGLFIWQVHILSFLKMCMFIVLFPVVYLLQFVLNGQNSVSTGTKSVILWHFEWVQIYLTIGWSGIEGCGFLLRDFLHFSIQLWSGGLVESHFLGNIACPDGVQQPQGASGIHIRRVLCHLKRHLHQTQTKCRLASSWFQSTHKGGN